MAAPPAEVSPSANESRGAVSGVVHNAQVLRFVAAGLVLMSHLQHEAVDLGLQQAEWSPVSWGFGVDIFFVISGFVMYLTSADDFGRPNASRSFLVRRLIRIVPIYWAFTTLTIVAATAGFVAHDEYSLSYIVSSYLFFPWPRPSDGDIAPVLSLGWTLNYEMFFYFVFAAALALPRRIGIALILVSFLSFAALHGAMANVAPAADFWTRPIILEFVAGMGVAALYRSGFRIPAMVALPVALLAFFLPPNDAPMRFLSWGIPATIIVGCVVLQPELPNGKVRRFLCLLGAASYALYLSHPFTIGAVGVLWDKVATGVASPGYFLVAAVASIVVSVLVHKIFEAPAGAFLKRKFTRPSEKRLWPEPGHAQGPVPK